VKKILGTAEDYRRLYGAGEAGRAADEDADAKPAVASKAAPKPKAAAAKKSSAHKKKIG
jgi:hypothetical protein